MVSRHPLRVLFFNVIFAVMFRALLLFVSLNYIEVLNKVIPLNFSFPSFVGVSGKEFPHTCYRSYITVCAS